MNEFIVLEYLPKRIGVFTIDNASGL